MKILVIFAVLIFNAAFSLAQTPKNETEFKKFEELFKEKELEELKELEAQVKKYYEERDRILSKPQVIYYSPVLNPSADRIAYIKRTVEYRLKGGGLVPFLSSPPEVQWISDVIELCQRDIASGREKVVSRWQLPKPDYSNDVGGVFVKLEWSDGLFYEINLASYKTIAIAGGQWCSGSGFCLDNKGGTLKGVTSLNGGVAVGLDIDQERHRYPASNNIILK